MPERKSISLDDLPSHGDRKEPGRTAHAPPPGQPRAGFGSGGGVGRGPPPPPSLDLQIPPSLDLQMSQELLSPLCLTSRSSSNLETPTDGRPRSSSSSAAAAAAAAHRSDRGEPEVICLPTRRYDPSTSEITGFLIDLDGTVYRPKALIPGACAFHEFLVSTGKPFVYLSNTGAKSSDAVRRKLRTPQYYLSAERLPEHSVFTAAEAQVEFMAANIPRGAKVLVISGGGDFWLRLLRERCPGMLDEWELRTKLSEDEAKKWATVAAVHAREPLVWVVLFIDGPLSNCPDPVTGEASPEDWSYELVRNCSYLLGHGAHLVYTADDSSNPSTDDAFGGYVWPMPGPGMFASMLACIMQPRHRAQRVHCLGKGGNRGREYMMEHAIELLKRQGHDGDRSKICMVGDRFDTDVRGGRSVGVKTCLVESGAHSLQRQLDFPDDAADYVASSLSSMHLCRRSSRARAVSELPMVLRQPLRMWVLAIGNGVSSNAVARRGSAPKIDECLKEFYKGEAAVGPFGKWEVMKALDEIGLEVSERQVDEYLSGLCLAGLMAPRATIPFAVFASMMKQILTEVGIDPYGGPVHADASERSRAYGQLRQQVGGSADKRRMGLLASGRASSRDDTWS